MKPDIENENLQCRELIAFNAVLLIQPTAIHTDVSAGGVLIIKNFLNLNPEKILDWVYGRILIH